MWTLLLLGLSLSMAVPVDEGRGDDSLPPPILQQDPPPPPPLLQQEPPPGSPIIHTSTTKSFSSQSTGISISMGPVTNIVDVKQVDHLPGDPLPVDPLHIPQTDPLPTPLIPDSSHWEQIASFSISPSLPVTKYRSNLTGLTVVLAQAESPIVNGYFCLATETHDNDGLPHTLEHLVFLGSEDYPYKEVLDLLANRCLADRTNAWTDTDHTCYTVYTAGSSGFLHILPVYIDHILHPLLREEDYLTEVHHINAEGHDAGVVYSEMQGVEQSSANVMYFALAKKLYPGDSGYSQETGGYLENLRSSTTIEKVRNYHRDYYRPENLVITLTGQIEVEQVFEALRNAEEKILRKRAKDKAPEYIRPWQKKLEKFVDHPDNDFFVEYSSEDASIGNVAVAWRINKKISDDIDGLEAYDLIMKYLTTTQVSPFEAEFVENNDPLATSVSFDTLEVAEPALLVEFENVPTARLNEISGKMDTILKKIVKDGVEHFDLERIHNFIDRKVVSSMKDIENSPHLFLPDASVLDMLYGQDPSHLEKFVKSSLNIKNLKEKDEKFWLDLIENTFINNPKLVVKGRPSPDLLKSLTEKEEMRILKQVSDLGTEGLMEKHTVIENAIDSQKLPGHDVLEEIPLGDVNAIKFRSLTSYNRTNNINNLIDFSSLPFKTNIDDVNSNFVEFYIFMETSKLSPRQKKFLPLLLDTWLVSPLQKNGEIVNIDKIVKRRSKTLQSVDNSLGFQGSTFSPGAYSNAYLIEAQSTLVKFANATEFLSDAINYPYITKEKLNTTAVNILNNIPTIKLSATDVQRTLFDGMYFDNTSNIYHTSFIKQKAFLESLIEDIKTKPEEIVSEVYDIIQTLARPENAFVHIATDIEKLVQQEGASLPSLTNLFNSSLSLEPVNLDMRFQLKSEYGFRQLEAGLPRHVGFGVGGTESCFLKQSILYNNTDWTHPEVASVRVMLQYLSDRMYDEVRGQGLTYGISMSASVTEGRLSLGLTRSSQVVEAYKEVREILQRYLDSESEWDPILMDSAKGSMIYSWTEKEETIENMVGQAIKAYFRNTDAKYNRGFVSALAEVELEDLVDAANKFLPLFLDPSTTQTVIVCNPSAINTVINSFHQFGIELQTYSSLEESFLAE